MREYQIIMIMGQTVERYILHEKNTNVKIDIFQIVNSQDQLNKLIDAYNYITNGKA